MSNETRKSRMERLLKEAFHPTVLTLNDETSMHLDHMDADKRQMKETHFTLFIKSEKLKVMGRAAAHRAINQVLKREYLDGLHALSIHVQ